MPELYSELDDIRTKLEKHFNDMQDIEFTIQEGKLYMLQCRNGKRTGTAALNMAMDMLDEKLIDEKTAVMRVAARAARRAAAPDHQSGVREERRAVRHRSAGRPRRRVRQDRLHLRRRRGMPTKPARPCILVREETNPEDVEGMRAAEGILTARGGMTSHAALVARGWGKCCIVGAGDLKIDAKAKTAKIAGADHVLKEGDVDHAERHQGQGLRRRPGDDGRHRESALPGLHDAWSTSSARWACAPTPTRRQDAKVARAFGAEGIGLFRTEHMFYGAGSDEPLFLLRKMILSKTADERKAALAELFPFVKTTSRARWKRWTACRSPSACSIRRCTSSCRRTPAKQKELAASLGIAGRDVKKRGEALHETNPMMGHRGVRLGITYPEVTEMQVRAIFEAPPN